MPLDQRYVVAAFDERGDRLAFISSSFEWVQSARKAAIFQSQIDANYFIKKNNLSDNQASEAPDLLSLDHARPLYVKVDIKITDPAYNPDDPDMGISFSGMG